MSGEIGSARAGPAARPQIAGYQIEEQLGRGGMAVVYRALDVRLGRHVALKVLAPELARSESFRRRFIHESRAAAAVDHPHIIPIFEAGETADALFIAMRYVAAGDLRALLARSGILPAGRAAAITAQIASALDAAHAHGLVHRDVKPANLLITAAADGRSDHAYLSDFGLSKRSLAPLGLTLTGQFLGTLDYVAPEQIESRPVGGQGDQYSLACTTVEMLTGAPPFQRDENMAVLWAQLSAPPPSVTERRPDLPPAVDRVIATALAKSPDDRFPTCTAFAAALRAACAQQPAGRRDWPSSASPGPGRRPSSATRGPGRPSSATPGPGRPRSASAGPTSVDPPAPPPRTAARRGRPRRRGLAVVTVIMSLLALVAIAIIGARLVHRHATAASADLPATPSASAIQTRPPAGTVRAYFAAISRRDYAEAWKLGGRSTGQSYRAFVSGYQGTARDAVTILSTSGSVVTARLAATQTDGAIRTYQGTYTVSNGVITDFDVRRTG